MKHPRDCADDCPGDPLCPHTDLAAVYDRERIAPAMARLSRYAFRSTRIETIHEYLERLYNAACAVLAVEPAEPVNGYEWRDGPQITYTHKDIP